MRVTETVWMPYPECKPEKPENGAYFKVYLTTSLQEHGLFTNRNTYFFDTETPYFEYDEDAFKVVAFAELPAPYDPTATEFNFATAKRWMEGGAVCRAIQNFKDASGDDFTIDYKIVDNKLLRHYGLSDTWDNDELSLAEINGKWRKV
jgi:hypothetical protein